MTVPLEWEKVNRINPQTLHELEKEQMEELVDMFAETEDWQVADKAPKKITHVFQVLQALLKTGKSSIASCIKLVLHFPPCKTYGVYALPSGRRYMSLHSCTTRLTNSFIHQTVRMLKSLPSLTTRLPGS